MDLPPPANKKTFRAFLVLNFLIVPAFFGLGYCNATEEDEGKCTFIHALSQIVVCFILAVDALLLLVGLFACFVGFIMGLYICCKHCWEFYETVKLDRLLKSFEAMDTEKMERANEKEKHKEKHNKRSRWLKAFFGLFLLALLWLILLGIVEGLNCSNKPMDKDTKLDIQKENCPGFSGFFTKLSAPFLFVLPIGLLAILGLLVRLYQCLFHAIPLDEEQQIELLQKGIKRIDKSIKRRPKWLNTANVEQSRRLQREIERIEARRMQKATENENAGEEMQPEAMF